MQALSDGQQMERLESRVDDLGDRIDHVETNLGAQIDRVETKLDSRISGVEAKMESIRAESRAYFRVLLGVILTMF